MAFTVVYDACVLFPNALRDLLIRLAQTGLFRAKWSAHILDEMVRSLRDKYRDLEPERLDRTRRLMVDAVRDCMVERYEDLIGAITLPDIDDRHVVAAAVRAGAQLIVTFNLKDFPKKALDHYDLEAQHPDDFVRNVVDLDVSRVARVVREQARALKNPPMTSAELLERLLRHGLAQSVAALRPHVADDDDAG